MRAIRPIFYVLAALFAVVALLQTFLALRAIRADDAAGTWIYVTAAVFWIAALTQI